ncbi:MFS transporter [Saccharothrix sp. AJ9571]|nr:MFS transporter [Saccharothrix sp. AJ9571]
MSGREGLRQRLALPVLLIGTFLGVLDGYVVTVALPSVQHALEAGQGQTQWVAAGYGLAYAVTLVIGARLGDRYGRRRMFVVGMTAFAASSAVCALTPDATVLVAARLAHGMSAAVALPQVLAVIRHSFPDRRRQSAISWYGAVVGTGVSIGPVLAGVLLTAASDPDGWRWLFAVNVPVALAAAVSARWLVTESRSASVPDLDAAGAVLLSLGLAALLGPLTWLSEVGWRWPIAAVLPLAPLALTAFVIRNRTLARNGRLPLFPPVLAGDRRFTTGIGAVLLLFFAGAGAPLLFVLTFYLQSTIELSATLTGWLFAPLGIGFALASSLVPRWAKPGTTAVPAWGATLVAACLSAMLVLVWAAPVGAQPAALACLLFVAGIGQGLAVNPLLGLVLSVVPADDAGVASGTLLTATQLGNVLGVTVVGTTFFTGQSSGGTGSPSALTAALAILIAGTAGLVPVIRVIGRTQHRTAAGKDAEK